MPLGQSALMTKGCPHVLSTRLDGNVNARRMVVIQCGDCSQQMSVESLLVELYNQQQEKEAV